MGIFDQKKKGWEFCKKKKRDGNSSHKKNKLENL